MDADRIRIELTKAQQEQIKHAIGQDLEVLDLTFEEFERRIAPYYTFQNGWPIKYAG